MHRLMKVTKNGFPINIIITLILGIIIGYFIGTGIDASGSSGQAAASDMAEVGTIPVFRVWNLEIGDHFYTTSETERDYMLKKGYVREGRNIAYLYPVQVIDSVPVFIFYSSQLTDHFYTLDPNAEGLTGYVEDGILGYLYNVKKPASVPFYRLYNPVNGDHFYTTDKNEVKSAKIALWEEEGILGYLYTNHGNRARRV